MHSLRKGFNSFAGCFSSAALSSEQRTYPDFGNNIKISFMSEVEKVQGWKDVTNNVNIEEMEGCLTLINQMKLKEL